MKIKHFICEDVRQEINGKVTLTGLFPDDFIYIPNVLSPEVDTTEIPFIERLMLLANISEHDGDVSSFLEVLKPDGTQHGKKTSMGEFNVQQGKSFNLIMSLGGFPIPVHGTYKIVLTFNETIYEIPITITPEK